MSNLAVEVGFVTYSVQLSAQVTAVEGCASSTSSSWVEGSTATRCSLQCCLIVVNAGVVVGVQKALVIMKLSYVLVESLMLRAFLRGLRLVVQVELVEVIRVVGVIAVHASLVAVGKLAVREALTRCLPPLSERVFL